MRDRRLATRYAGALLASAGRDGDLAAVAESYAAVRELLGQRPELGAFLRGPQVSEDEKRGLLRTLFGGRIEPLLLNFCLLLIDKNRIENLDEIGQEFARLVERAQGLQRAVVTTAVPLPPDLEGALAKQLETLTGTRIVLEKRVDPAVIGGVAVVVGDNVIDGTVRASLQHLRARLLKSPLPGVAAG